MAAYAAARRARGEGLHAEGREGRRSSASASSTARRSTLVDGLITDAGRIAAETRQAARLVRRLHAEGAVPHRRQEDDGLRARRAARLELPDWIIYPTGGGTGMVGMWKAFEEMRAHRLEADRHAAAAWSRCRPSRLRADRPRLRAGRRAIGDVAERAHRRRRPARAEGDRRLPRAARRARERRHRARRHRRRHGARHARARPPRRHQRRAGRRRRADALRSADRNAAT